MYLKKAKKTLPVKSKDFFWNQVSKNVQNAQYAVRGMVPATAHRMRDEMAKNPHKYPFSEITSCNIGNPHEFNQKPITFNRQVLACMLNPELLTMKGINIDAAKRAQSYLKQIISAGSYTHSLGIPFVRRSIAKYLARNDEIEQPSIENIHTTDGASQGVHLLLNSLLTCQDDSVMIPVPQYPLYSAALTLYGGHACPYYLNEQKGWQLDLQQLQRSIDSARRLGKNVKALVVINPGNPTGAVFSHQTIQKIIQFCVKNKLVIMADQVYRTNIYKKGVTFHSFRKVLNTMGPQYRDQCELASLNSVSKGLLGQCGLRGGYMYVHNMNPKIMQQVNKLKSISLCSNTVGQGMVQLMCNPPIQNVQEETKNQYLTEVNDLFESLKKRGQLVTEAMQSMDNITCHEVQGAMYAFPQIRFSPKAIQAAGNQAADLFYCLQLLKETGIALVPGSGFRQKQGTYHFRITTLILPQQRLKNKLEDFKRFNKSFHKKYE